MIAHDRDALVCDLAETYGIFDMRSLPATLLAALSSGLRENSRIKMKMAGITLTLPEMLLAAIADRLAMQNWLMSEDGANGVNRPKSILTALLGADGANSGVMTFDSPEDFEAEWLRRTGVSHGK